MARFNHGFDIAFSLINSDESGNATPKELRTAILERLASLADDELLEAIGAPFDTFQVAEV